MGRFQESQAGVDFVNSLHTNGNQPQSSPPFIPGKSNICSVIKTGSDYL